MRQVSRSALILVLVMFAAAPAWSALGDYDVTTVSSERMTLVNPTVIWAGSQGVSYANQVAQFDIGFTFRFDGVNYTRMSASTNGVLGLGTTNVTNSPTNNLTGPSIPILAPFWDSLRVSGGAAGELRPRVARQVVGNAPNRVLVIEFQDMDVVRQQGLSTSGTWQVRLYETTGRIEFWYGPMIPCSVTSADLYPPDYCANTSASIGIANGSANFISATPSSVGFSFDRATANNRVNINGVNPITPGATIAFTPTSVLVTSNGQPVPSGTTLFAGRVGCVGESAYSVPLVFTNSGRLPITISSATILELGSSYITGTSYYPLIRDARGNPVVSSDYAMTTTPGIAPLNANAVLATPATIPVGGTLTLYATYVGFRPGPRYARVILRTDASNVFGTDTNVYDANTMPTMNSGLITFDLLARAEGGSLAANLAGDRLAPVIFNAVRIGDTTTMMMEVANAGLCALRIDRARFRIITGDVNEFSIAQTFRHATVDAITNDYLLAPRSVDTLVLRFVPSRSGSRMATLMFKTNDSTLQNVGITEPGTYRVDLWGRGLAGLDARPLVLAPVVIGNAVTGQALLENNLNTAVTIVAIAFVGGDSSQFSPSPAWPPLPLTVVPGDVLKLGVQMTPVGQPGIRRTTLRLILSSGDTVRVPVRGEAGTQQLVVSPLSLFQTTTIGVGASARKSVVISNAGTLPIRLRTPRILPGPDSANYRLAKMDRLDLEPGQTEFLEVTFAPKAQGQSSAELEISAAGGTPIVVTLGGEALLVRGGGDSDPAADDAIAAVTVEARPSGRSVISVAPNPASDRIAIDVRTAATRATQLELYAATGERIAVIDREIRGGERVAMDVSALPSGCYLVRARFADGGYAQQQIVVAR